MASSCGISPKILALIARCRPLKGATESLQTSFLVVARAAGACDGVDTGQDFSGIGPVTGDRVL
jgi:hypothetical protein